VAGAVDRTHPALVRPVREEALTRDGAFGSEWEPVQEGIEPEILSPAPVPVRHEPSIDTAGSGVNRPRAHALARGLLTGLSGGYASMKHTVDAHADSPAIGSEQSRTLLIVDDNQSIRESLSWLLSMADYRVLEASSGDEAMGIIEREHPGLVVTDLQMPEMHGTDFIRLVRGSEPTIASTPIVALSVHGPVELEEARAAGADACVDKLSDFDELLAAVRSLAA
jgi:CheY-like chemotaxis protein